MSHYCGDFPSPFYQRNQKYSSNNDTRWNQDREPAYYMQTQNDSSGSSSGRKKRLPPIMTGYFDPMLWNNNNSNGSDLISSHDNNTDNNHHAHHTHGHVHAHPSHNNNHHHYHHDQHHHNAAVSSIGSSYSSRYSTNTNRDLWFNIHQHHDDWEDVPNSRRRKNDMRSNERDGNRYRKRDRDRERKRNRDRDRNREKEKFYLSSKSRKSKQLSDDTHSWTRSRSRTRSRTDSSRGSPSLRQRREYGNDKSQSPTPLDSSSEDYKRRTTHLHSHHHPKHSISPVYGRFKDNRGEYKTNNFEHPHHRHSSPSHSSHSHSHNHNHNYHHSHSPSKSKNKYKNKNKHKSKSKSKKRHYKKHHETNGIREKSQSQSHSESYEDNDNTSDKNKSKNKDKDSQSSGSKKRVSAPSHDMNEGEEGTARWKVGDKLRGGRYIVKSYLDSGAFSTVLDCLDTKRNENVAIKVVRSVRKYLDSARIEVDILSDITKHDPDHRYNIIRFFGSFETRLNSQKHVCIAFEKMSCSLYQFVKKNHYRGFLIEHLRNISKQIFEAINFIHEKLHLVHTDLKLENILLVEDSYTTVHHPHFGRRYRIPNQVNIRLIDFGGATYEKFDEKTHAKRLRFETINTRQYRAPEVILGIGWDCSSDLWSIGCILSELYTGDLLFATHENIEHLAMMEKVLEYSIPKHLVEKVIQSSEHHPGTHHLSSTTIPSPSLSATSSKGERKRDLKRSMSPHVRKGEFVDDTFFDKENLRLRWPEVAISKESIKHVEERDTLKRLIVNSSLRNLIFQCLQIDQKKRITARQALDHAFFKEKSTL